MKYFFKTKDATMVFLGSMILYLIIGSIFAVNTKLVLNKQYICDLYFGFDNAFYGSSAVRHPLISVISKISEVFQLNDSLFLSLVIVFICSLFLSFQNLFVFRILNEILKLTNRISIQIITIFAVYGANLLLSFTFDSYVFSGAILSAFFFYFLKSEKEGVPLNRTNYYLFSAIIGGVTVTNFLKVALVSVLSKFKAVYFKRLIWFFGIILVPVLLFYERVLRVLSFTLENFAKSNSFFSDAFHYFFGSIFIIPSVEAGELKYINGENFMSVVGSAHSYFESALLVLLLVLFSFIIIKNIRLKIIQFCLLFFAVDVFIHLIMKLGLSEAYIFSGNYAFLFPIILGASAMNSKSWLEKNFQIPAITIIALLLFFNLQELHHLYNFGVEFYPR